MEKYPVLRLKPGREKAVRNFHHWLFLGAIEEFPDAENGSLAEVRTHEGTHLGYAYFHRDCSLCARIVSFGHGDPLETIRENIVRACDLRKELIDTEETTAYRLVNSEGDMLPGLIVDRYGDVLVLQVSTLGMERLKSLVLETLLTHSKPAAVYEKSGGPARASEGLPESEGLLHGTVEEPVEIRENGLRFLVSFRESQKTGFFLDQREMRRLVRDIAHGRTLLNCFAYTGGFTVAALAGGAVAADAVDVSAEALALGEKNLRLNGFDEAANLSYAEDAFEFLSRHTLKRPYDFIILDPPAFAKRSSNVERAVRGYQALNRLALAHLPPGSLLLTCSCSNHVNADLFQTILFHASKEAKRRVRIIQRNRLAFDHPVNICHPESEYLKSLLLLVD